MRPRHSALCLFLSLVLVSAAHGQDAPPPEASGPRPPNYSIKISAYFESEALAAFGKRVEKYVELRASLEPGLPPLEVTTKPAEINRAENALGRRIREARAGSRRGDIFVFSIETQIKKMLGAEVDENTLETIKDDNPGAFSFDLNGRYPKDRTVSTMPANLLQLLPQLPDGVEYRFVGRHLILRDMKANIIIDDIPYAVRCHDCKIRPD